MMETGYLTVKDFNGNDVNAEAAQVDKENWIFSVTVPEATPMFMPSHSGLWCSVVSHKSVSPDDRPQAPVVLCLSGCRSADRCGAASVSYTHLAEFPGAAVDIFHIVRIGGGDRVSHLGVVFRIGQITVVI